MSDFIDTESGYMSIQDYVDAPLLLANELIGHANFPTEFKVLKDTMGVIFNYFGRRSICKMYSKDYQDKVAFDEAIEIRNLRLCVMDVLTTKIHSKQEFQELIGSYF